MVVTANAQQTRALFYHWPYLHQRRRIAFMSDANLKYQYKCIIVLNRPLKTLPNNGLIWRMSLATHETVRVRIYSSCIYIENGSFQVDTKLKIRDDLIIQFEMLRNCGATVHVHYYIVGCGL